MYTLILNESYSCLIVNNLVIITGFRKIGKMLDGMLFLLLFDNTSSVQLCMCVLYCMTLNNTRIVVIVFIKVIVIIIIIDVHIL